MNAFLTIALLTLFVVLHELGHYISAKRSKIAVSEFFVGFGPRLFSFKRNNTEYGLKALLLGGYVKIPSTAALVISISTNVVAEIESIIPIF